MTANWTTAQIARAVQGELIGNSIAVSGVCTDTRSITVNELFIALQGPNFDGHDYLEHARQHGAVAAMVSKQIDIDLPQVLVSDTRLALGELARAWRQQFSIPVIGITGSNGKTTVKELSTAIMNCEHSVLATEGNLNNDIGMPLTLLKLQARHTAAVIEMGANHPGEIDYLTHISLPDVAVITNAGPAHLEGFGDLDGVARAKGEIYSSLNSEGTAIINADDAYYDYWKSVCKGKKVMSFGLDNKADVFAEQIGAEQAGSELVITTPAGKVNVSFKLPGKHNLLNALAATAACIAAGVKLDSVKQGLESANGVRGRLQLRSGLSGSRIIDDTYNANPASLNAALDVLSQYSGKHLLALGDMGELGSDAEQLHANAGEQAKASGVEKLFAIGEFAGYAAQGFGLGGQVFEDQPSMISEIGNELNEDVTLLVKGSRLMHMENIVDALSINGEI